MAATAFAMTSLGLAIAWRIDSIQGYHGFMNLLLGPMWLLSGAVFPAEGGAAWVGWLMRLNPLTYGLAALRSGLGAGSGTAVPAALAAVGSFALLAFLLALRVVAGAAPPRRGSLGPS
jgi:ABC-type polysaccharide/polyol phosphate export permease